MPYSKTSVDVNVQAPIGGWNTRDAFDDISPTDAITMDNWLPGLGAVAVREGKSVHGVASDAGSNLVINGDFEDGTFPPWAWSLTVFIDSSLFYAGLYSAKMNGSPYATIYLTQEMAVTADTDYVISMMSIITGPKPPSVSAARYIVTDETNGGVEIVSSDLPTGSAWRQSALSFVTPPGCVLIKLEINAPTVANAILNVDDISIRSVLLNPDPVETLMSYDSTTHRELISADNDAVRNSTAQGVPITLGTGFASNRWGWSNFDGYLIMVNGVDAPQEYEGTALGPLTPALSGGITNPVGCHAFKNRMYYWDNQSQDIWYTELFARGGTLTRFQLSRLTKFGGNLIATETWTMDGGTGPDDHLVFIMSSGEVIVYQGSSPASASNWALVGIYDIGVPLCSRCTVKFGPDLLIMTDLDIVSMSKIIQGPEALADRSKVSGALEDVVQFLGSPLFEAVIYPTKKVGIFTVPAPGQVDSHQFVQNLVTGAWCRFKGWNSHSWASLDGKLYMGGEFGTTYEVFKGTMDQYWDGSQLTDNAIESELQTAWLTFGSTENKSFNSIKPIFDAVGLVNYNFDIQTDFSPFKEVLFPSVSTQAGTPWYSPWYSPWGEARQVGDDWKIVRGYGRFVGCLFKFSTTNVVKWAATIWHIEQGTRM